MATIGELTVALKGGQSYNGLSISHARVGAGAGQAIQIGAQSVALQKPVNVGDATLLTTGFTAATAYPIGTPLTDTGAQVGTLSGIGVPPASLGNDGDHYLRKDGTAAAHTVMYHKEAGAWVATAA